MAGKKSTLAINPRLNSNLSLLNEKTIGKICEYLDLYDWLQIGEIDVNYQRIIGERFISKQMLNISAISKHYPVRHAFKQFGEFAKDLNIKESDIQYKDSKYTDAEEIFRLIKKRCVAERLVTVAICFDKSERHINADHFLDVFANVRSLTVSMAKEQKLLSNEFDVFLQKLLINCKKLRSLHLKNIYGEFKFLLLPQLNDLKSLCFEHCTIKSQGWSKFTEIGVRPLKYLKIFKTEIEDKFCVPLRVAESFPSLETFIFMQRYTFFVDYGYEAFQNMKHLKEVHIYDSKYTNLISALSKRGTVERLSLRLSGILSVPIGIQSLTNLRSIEFLDDPVMRINEIHCEIYKEFLKLHQLSEFILDITHLSPHGVEGTIEQIIVSSPWLRVLKLKGTYRQFSTAFYCDLVSARRYRCQNASKLNLHAKFKHISRDYMPNIITIRHD